MINDLTNRRFGRLLVLRRATIAQQHKAFSQKACWHVRCDCGNEKIMLSNNLRRATSCGCARAKHSQSHLGTA